MRRAVDYLRHEKNIADEVKLMEDEIKRSMLIISK